jgi:hypothetical protein
MLSEKRHRDPLNADVAGVVAGNQRILESNLTGECSRRCVRGDGDTYLSADADTLDASN